MRTALPLVVVSLLGCSGGAPLTDAERSAVQAEVEAELRQAYDLSKPGVADRMMALYPEGSRIISANTGRVTSDRDSVMSGIRYFWENVGVNMKEPRWVWDGFHTDVLSRDAAVVTAAYHIPHRNPRNEPHVLGGAMTLLMQKKSGRWVVTQEHLSDTPQRQIQDSTSP
ncbi:MAG TPA: DUF4440 domain-containing protein [Gemmatimonadaceae bacterium]|nr:DUF4440 domain-containing protein [Gemmatimonadaceae bacterium]